MGRLEEAKVGSTWKFGGEEGEKKQGILQAGAAETPRALLSSEWGCPLGDPRARLLGCTTPGRAGGTHLLRG